MGRGSRAYLGEVYSDLFHFTKISYFVSCRVLFMQSLGRLMKMHRAIWHPFFAGIISLQAATGRLLGKNWEALHQVSLHRFTLPVPTHWAGASKLSTDPGIGKAATGKLPIQALPNMYPLHMSHVLTHH